MMRSEVIRALRQLREDNERAIGTLLAQLEAEAGKKDREPDAAFDDASAERKAGDT
ncbi:MAG: hypothetical protein IT348_20040 [Candidatus Eisenbacteria bacterium]|nr:hypothetical protein [Candidatus Eisenbacteria bacterium]